MADQNDPLIGQAPDQSAFDRALNDVFAESGRRQLIGADPMSSNEALAKLKSNMAAIGVPVSDEEGSQFVYQHLPNSDIGFIDSMKMAAGETVASLGEAGGDAGRFLAGLLGGAVKYGGTAYAKADQAIQNTIGPMLGLEPNPIKAEPFQQAGDAIYDTVDKLATGWEKDVRSAVTGGYQPQGIVGKLGKELTHTVVRSAPALLMAMEGNLAPLTETLSAGAPVVAQAIQGTGLGARMARWATTALGEEAAMGFSFGLANTAMDSHVQKALMGGEVEKAGALMATELVDQTVVGAGLGLGLRAVFKPFALAYESLRRSKVDELVKPGVEPTMLDSMLNNSQFITPEENTLLVKTSELFDRIRSAGKAGDVEGLAQATTELQLMGPDTAKELLRLKGNQLDSLYYSIFEHRPEGELDTLASMGREWMRSDTLTNRQPSKFFFDAEMKFQELRSDMNKLREIAPLDKQSSKLLDIFHDDVQREFNALREFQDPGVRLILDKNYRGEQLTKEEESWINSALIIEKMQTGSMAPDLSNPAMAKLREILIPGELSEYMMGLTGARQGVDVSQTVFDYAHRIENLMETAKTKDVEGVIQLLGTPEGATLNWTAVLGKLVESRQGALEKLFAGTDADQMVTGLQNLMRDTFLGKKDELAKLLATTGAQGEGSLGYLFKDFLLKQFPSTFGDFKPSKGYTAEVSKTIRMGLQYGMGLDTGLAQTMMDNMVTGFKALRDGGLMTPEAYQNHMMVAGFWDTMMNTLFKNQGYRPSALAAMGDHPLGNALAKGDITSLTGLTRLYTTPGSLSNLSAAERNKLIYAGAHEAGHAITMLLPGEVRDSLFTALAESYKNMGQSAMWIFGNKAVNQVPTYMYESGHEAMAELFARTLMARIARNDQQFSELARAIPPNVRTAFMTAAREASAAMDKSPFADSAIGMIFRKFMEVGKAVKMEEDPFYKKVLKDIREAATPPEKLQLLQNRFIDPQDVKVLSMVLPAKNAFKDGRLTEEGSMFVKQNMGLELETGAEVTDVNAAIMQRAMDRASLIKAKAPQGSRSPEDLFSSAYSALQELESRVNAMGSVGQVYRDMYGPKVQEYIETLRADLNKLGGFWLRDTDKEAMGSYGELVKHHAVLENLVASGRGANPRLWDTMDYKFAGSWLTKAYRAARKSEFMVRHFGEPGVKDLDNIDIQGMNVQWLAKKYPVLGAVADIWRGAAEKKVATVAKVLANEDNILGDATVRPLSEYLKLGSSPSLKYIRPAQYQEELLLRDMTNKLLLIGNDYANQVAKRGSRLEWPEMARDLNGSILDKGALRRHLESTQVFGYGPQQFSDELFESAYGLYAGVNATMRFMRDETHKINTIRRSRTGDMEGIANERLEIGRLSGSIAQVRHGDHAMVVYTKDGHKMVQFFDAGTLSSMKNMVLDGIGKQAKSGMAWAQEMAQKIRREGSAEWGIDQGNVADIKIFKRNELPKDVYFGARPSNLDAILTKAREVLAKKDGTNQEALAEITKAMQTELVDISKGGGFMSHSRYRDNVPGWDTVNLQDTLRESLDQFAGFHSRTQALEHSLDALRLTHGQGKVFGYGSDLISHMAEGMDKSAWIGSAMRGMSYWHYMAGKVSTAAMQITQNYMMGVSRLGMEGVPRAGRQITGAMRDITKLMTEEYKNYYTKGVRGVLPDDMIKKGFSKLEAQALHDAQLSGVTWANFTKQFMEGEGSFVKSTVGNLMETTALPLRLMEELNRRSIFLVGFRHNIQALEQEVKAGKRTLTAEELYNKAFERAVRISNDAHIIYDRANLPAWARTPNFAGSVGRGLYALKNFSHGYLQFLGWLMREDPQWINVGKSLGFLLGAGGLTALPGFDVFEKLFGEKDGVSWREKLEGKMGRGAAQYVINGPLGNWTNFGERLNPVSSTLFSTTLTGMTDDVKRTVDLVKRGDYASAVAHSPISPAGLTSLYDAWEGQRIGKMTKAGKLLSLDGKPVKYSFEDAMTKALGFTPYDADLVQWYRERAKDEFWNKQKAEMADRVRSEYARKGSISNEMNQDFQALRLRASQAGRPMKAMNPWDVVKGGRIYSDN